MTSGETLEDPTIRRAAALRRQLVASANRLRTTAAPRSQRDRCCQVPRTHDVAGQRRLDDMVHRDELTGLHNRRALMAALDGRLAARQPTAVIFLDLDGFKLVNDTHGHDVGDGVLVAFAERLSGIVREDDFVARSGGDEFVVIARPEQSEALAERVVRELAWPFSLDGRAVVVGTSAGVTNFDASGPLQPSEGLLHRADRAMYEAKRRGKGRVVTAG